jgi:hypothetical protein
MTPTTYVHTLGDSTLDNYWWLINGNSTNKDDADATCVEGKLQKELYRSSSNTYQVVSHAYDGFTTKSVLYGDRIGSVLPGYPCDGFREAYKDRKRDVHAEQGVTYPLRNLARSVDAYPQDCTML